MKFKTWPFVVHTIVKLCLWKLFNEMNSIIQLLQAPSAEMQPVEGSDAQPEAPPVMSEEEKREKRLEEGIGIPNIILDCGSREENKPQHQLIVDSGKLPSVEEVCE